MEVAPLSFRFNERLVRIIRDNSLADLFCCPDLDLSASGTQSTLPNTSDPPCRAVVFQAAMRTFVTNAHIAVAITRELSERLGNLFRLIGFTSFAGKLPCGKRRGEISGRSLVMPRNI